MKKHTLLILSMVALLVGCGQAQDEPQALSDLLLDQDVFREIFEDDSWVLATRGSLPENPPGIIDTTTAVYESPARRLNWTILEFEVPEGALDFIRASSDGLRPNLKEDAEEVTDQINVDVEGDKRVNLADIVMIARFLDDPKSRLTLVRGNLAIFFESDLSDEALVLLAQLQIDQLAELGR